MSVENFISQNYAAACKEQRSLSLDKDMVDMASANSITRGDSLDLTMNWMRRYGLFQGISGEMRPRLAEKYIDVVHRMPPLDREAGVDFILEQAEKLHCSLCEVKNRKWLSATTKLLWCKYPNDVVIYDKWVENAVIALQGIVPRLYRMERLGACPGIKSQDGGVRGIISYYGRFQSLVTAFREEYRDVFVRLRGESSEIYPYDIRIIDKLLWFLGNPKVNFYLGEADGVMSDDATR